MKPRPLTKCATCPTLTVGGKVWLRMTSEQRKGLSRHAGYGLCTPCLRRKQRTPAPRKPRSPSVPLVVVLEEWEWMDHDRTASRAERVRRAAPRLGMTPDALDKALTRAGVAA